MSAEVLRRAAVLMRENVAVMSDETDIAPDAFMLAVAELLDREAAMCEEFLIDEDETPDALAVARAYLGNGRRESAKRAARIRKDGVA